MRCWCRDTPGAEVLERSPDGEAGASNLHCLQHAGISELVQNQRLVELVRHLPANSSDGNYDWLKTQSHSELAMFRPNKDI